MRVTWAIDVEAATVEGAAFAALVAICNGDPALAASLLGSDGAHVFTVAGTDADLDVLGGV